MLAQLKKIPGVVTVQVEVTGQYFVIIPTGERDNAFLVEKALEILGAHSVYLQEPESVNLVGGADLEEIWAGPDNIRSLSLLEVRILANNWGGSAASEAGLPPDLAQRLPGLLRVELTKEVDRIHAQGGTSDREWYKRAFPAAFERTIDGLETLAPSQADSLRSSLMYSLNA